MFNTATNTDKALSDIERAESTCSPTYRIRIRPSPIYSSVYSLKRTRCSCLQFSPPAPCSHCLAVISHKMKNRITFAQMRTHGNTLNTTFILCIYMFQKRFFALHSNMQNHTHALMFSQFSYRIIAQLNTPLPNFPSVNRESRGVKGSGRWDGCIDEDYVSHRRLVDT